MADEDATRIEPEPDGDDDFNPAAHVGDLGGRAYLEVKWRVVWLRRDAPDAEIVTELIERTPDFALFRASVIRPGNGSATGWGSETKGDFGDFIEKAETKALGRALAALGYGTAAAGDFEDGAAAGRPVDAPVGRQSQRGGGDLISDKQIKYAFIIGREAYLSGDEVDRLAGERYGSSIAGLSKRQASEFIDFLKAQGGEAAAADQRDHEDRQRGKVGPYAPPAPIVAVANPDPPTPAQLRKLHATAREKNWSPESVKAVMVDLWGVETSPMLSKHQCSLLIDLIEDRLTLRRDPDDKARLGQVGDVRAAAKADDGKLSLDDLPFDPAPVGAAT